MGALPKPQFGSVHIHRNDDRHRQFRIQFQRSRSLPHFHDLLRKGIDKDNLYKLVHNNASQSSIRLNGYAQYRTEYMCGGRMALISLSSDELRDFDYSKGDTEGLVNIPLTIPEVQWSIFMREDSKDLVKVSMRSKGVFPVNLVCEEKFGGGGHINASGGEYHGPLTDALSYLLQIIPDYESLLE